MSQLNNFQISAIFCVATKLPKSQWCGFSKHQRYVRIEISFFDSKCFFIQKIIGPKKVAKTKWKNVADRSDLFSA